MRSEPVHRILLRGPWDCEWLSGPDPELAELPTRVRMPVSWADAFGTVAGRVRFRRRFHQPTNLDPAERVALAFEGIGGTAVVRVNSAVAELQPGTNGILRCDVTDSLKEANEVTVEVDFDARSTDEPGGLWKPVAVEIHRTVD